MSITAQLKNLSALDDQIQSSGVDAKTRSELTQSVQGIKAELKAYEKDKVFYRIVVGSLGLTIILIIVAITTLLLNGVDQFDALTAIGSAAIGGLVGLLAPSPVAPR